MGLLYLYLYICVCVCVCVCVCTVYIYSESGGYVIYFICRAVSALPLIIVYPNTEYLHFLFFTLVKKGEQIVELLTKAMQPICSLIMIRWFKCFTSLLVITEDLEIM